MIQKIVTCVLCLLLTATFSFAASVNNDFIKFTDSALDALDEVEVIFTSTTGNKLDAEKALQKLDIAIKRYDRLNLKENSPEMDLMWKITYCKLQYDLVLLKGIYGPQHDEAKMQSKEIRELFEKYKTKNKKSKK